MRKSSLTIRKDFIPIGKDEKSEELSIMAKARAKRKNRTCLKCGIVFMSRGPQNRACKACLTANSSKIDFVSMYDIASVLKRWDGNG